MRILSWNYRGLGRSQDSKIPRLKEIRKKYFPEIMFLMETKQSKDMVVDLNVVLRYDRVFVVDPVGLAGGLAIFWKQEVGLEVKFSDKNIIDHRIRYGGHDFYVSFVYGEPSQYGKRKVWERLMRSGAERKEIWGMVGDFNGEKIGGPKRGKASFADFSEMLDVCEMKEITGSGDSFTWAGKRYQKYIQCKLDRCFGNKKWRTVFYKASQAFMERLGSDHRPVLVDLLSGKDRKRVDFGFDKRMVGKTRVRETIGEAWETARMMKNLSIMESLGEVRRSLGKWKRENTQNSNERMM